MVASPAAASGSLLIHQDARLYATQLAPEAPLDFVLDPERRAYVHLVRGKLAVNGMAMATGDGARIGGESALRLVARQEEGEVLLFDLPGAATQ